MKWFKHDTDANTDNRLQNVLLDYGLDGYGLYWYCLELIASKIDKDSVTFELEHDARVIARNTGCTAQKIEEMMRYFVSIGLFENADGVITCLKMAKRLDKSMTSNSEMRKIIETLGVNNTVLDGFVYFIEKRDLSGNVIAIKIGRSKNPTARLKEISKIDENVGFSLECIHRIKTENCVALETELHRKFKHLNIYNEWFTPHEDIYECIGLDYVMTTSDDVMQEEIRLEENKISLSAEADECAADGKGEESSPLTKQPENCPHQEIISLWHELMPELTSVKTWNEKRAKMLKARWNGKDMDGNKFNNLKFWRKYFEYIRESDWLMGKTGSGWSATLEWVITESNFNKIIEGTYHNAN